MPAEEGGGVLAGLLVEGEGGLSWGTIFLGAGLPQEPESSPRVSVGSGKGRKALSRGRRGPTLSSRVPLSGTELLCLCFPAVRGWWCPNSV